jgi:hypothetical protein
VENPLMNLLGLDVSRLDVWLNPATRNYYMLFVYYFVLTFISNIAYFWLPTLWTVSYFHIRTEKMTNMQKLQKKTDDSQKVKRMELKVGQKVYNCTVCGQKIDVGIKKCHKCGQLYRFVIIR